MRGSGPLQPTLVDLASVQGDIEMADGSATGIVGIYLES
jgi:hypothetical protein